LLTRAQSGHAAGAHLKATNRFLKKHSKLWSSETPAPHPDIKQYATPARKVWQPATAGDGDPSDLRVFPLADLDVQGCFVAAAARDPAVAIRAKNITKQSI
jgi:hypothetical protein